MEDLFIQNNSTVALSEIPELPYEAFMAGVLDRLSGHAERHCVLYFGYRPTSDQTAGTDQPLTREDRLKLICCLADDKTHLVQLTSSVVSPAETLASFTAQHHNFELFERELHEQFGLKYTDHPWLKPVRYTHDRFDKGQRIENYPFCRSGSEELHEVGVGPIHAGIIEPGHFRFICNGEQIMHLEIQLGYQHRGIEQLFLSKKKLLERTTLAETIAGDTVVGHTTAFVNLWETLCNFQPDCSLERFRTIAQELERIAIHTSDLSGVCTDIGYQLGNAVFSRLRTPIINFMQEWCGNRLSKGLIRAGRMNYPLTEALASRLETVLKAYEPDFDEMVDKLCHLPSALARMERTGVVSYDKVLEIGTVGMAARMSGLSRDIRASHPYNLYGTVIEHEPILKHHGDVYSRVQIRRYEIKQSIGYLRALLKDVQDGDQPVADVVLTPGSNKLVLSLVEGWRGEICHCAVTDRTGNLVAYRIKDPSFHNWMALAQAVQNNEISDFPICNKSFNLSYSGHDL